MKGVRKMVRKMVRKIEEQAGFVTIEFVLGCAFLLLPVAMLVLVMPTWSERQGMASVAAREAARTYVLTHSTERAQQTVNQIAENHDLRDDQMELTIEGNSTEPGATVKATVKIGVPVTVIPMLDANADAFTITKSHTEIVDLYRSRS